MNEICFWTRSSQLFQSKIGLFSPFIAVWYFTKLNWDIILNSVVSISYLPTKNVWLYFKPKMLSHSIIRVQHFVYWLYWVNCRNFKLLFSPKMLKSRYKTSISRQHYGFIIIYNDSGRHYCIQIPNQWKVFLIDATCLHK